MVATCTGQGREELSSAQINLIPEQADNNVKSSEISQLSTSYSTPTNSQTTTATALEDNVPVIPEPPLGNLNKKETVNGWLHNVDNEDKLSTRTSPSGGSSRIGAGKRRNRAILCMVIDCGEYKSTVFKTIEDRNNHWKAEHPGLYEWYYSDEQKNVRAERDKKFRADAAVAKKAKFNGRGRIPQFSAPAPPTVKFGHPFAMYWPLQP